jgi:hypothetical protein
MVDDEKIGRPWPRGSALGAGEGHGVQGEEHQVRQGAVCTRLKHMVEEDALTNDKVALYRRCKGGSVIGLLTGDTQPSRVP